MTATDALARNWVARLESNEAQRSSMPRKDARPIVARKLGVAPGTLENISRGRTKGLRVWVRERIRAAVLRELESEIRGLSHELQIARQCGNDAASPEVCAAKAALADAFALLNQFDSNGED